MQFLSISEDSPMQSRPEIADESTTPVYRLANGSFAEVFPVSPIVKQGSDSAPRTSAIYGLSVREHCGNYDQQLRSLRTCQGSLLLTEDDSLTEYLATFPRQGMMRNGKLYRLSTLERRTSGKESGSSVIKETFPTPNSFDSIPDFGDRASSNMKTGGRHSVNLRHLSKTWPTPQAHDAAKGNANRVGRFGTKAGGRNLNDEVMLWPTPRASDGVKGGPNQRDSSGNYALPGAVHHWPTPHGFSKDGKSNGPSGNELGRAVNRSLWPTQTAMNDTGGPALCKWGGSGSREKMKSMTTPEELNGSLNPQFVEWLMGYPNGWTDLKASVTPLSLKSPR